VQTSAQLRDKLGRIPIARSLARGNQYPHTSKAQCNGRAPAALRARTFMFFIYLGRLEA
jgi:hypothetical protein